MPTFDSLFKTDSNAEKDGVWHNIGSNVKVCVARSGTPEYNKILTQMSQAQNPESSLMLVGEMSDDQMEDMVEVTVKTMARAILKDWKGFDDDDGNPVEFSVEQAEVYLRNRDFRDLVARLSRNAEHYKVKNLREQAKN